ncbi:hypothetical protein HDU97_002538 [Phlyctochytrium planicorne]|nr:hypothetical protein HDU97_002538 [Phlyctochytrium planicorne]
MPAQPANAAMLHPDSVSPRTITRLSPSSSTPSHEESIFSPSRRTLYSPSKGASTTSTSSSSSSPPNSASTSSPYHMSAGGIPVAPMASLPALPPENASSLFSGDDLASPSSQPPSRQSRHKDTMSLPTQQQQPHNSQRSSLLKPVRVTRKEAYGRSDGGATSTPSASSASPQRAFLPTFALSLPSFLGGKQPSPRLSDSVPLGSTVSQAYIAEIKRKRRLATASASPSSWPSFWTRRRRVRRNSSGSCAATCLGSSCLAVCGGIAAGLVLLQVLGAPSYLFSRFSAASELWPNALYSMDPLAPLLYHTHSLLSLLFLAVLGPHLLHIISRHHQKNRHQEHIRSWHAIGAGSGIAGSSPMSESASRGITNFLEWLAGPKTLQSIGSNASTVLLKYPISSYWLAVMTIVGVSGIPAFVVESVDICWKVMALHESEMKRGADGTKWVHVALSVAMMPFGHKGHVGHSVPMAGGNVTVVGDDALFAEALTAVSRGGARMVTLAAAALLGVFLVYIRGLEAAEELAEKGHRRQQQQHHHHHQRTLDFVCPSSPALSVSSADSRSSRDLDTDFGYPVRKSSGDSSFRVSFAQADQIDEDAVAGVDGYHSVSNDPENGGSSRPSASSGRMSIKRVLGGVVSKGKSFLMHGRSASAPVALPRRMEDAAVSRPVRVGRFARFVARWSGSSLGLHLAFHLLLGGPWAILAVEQAFGVIVLKGVAGGALKSDGEGAAGARKDAGMFGWADVLDRNLVQPRDGLKNGTLASTLSGSPGGGPSVELSMWNASVSIAVAVLHLLVAFVLVILAMDVPDPEQQLQLQQQQHQRSQHQHSASASPSGPSYSSHFFADTGSKKEDARSPQFLGVPVVVDPFSADRFADTGKETNMSNAGGIRTVGNNGPASSPCLSDSSPLSSSAIKFRGASSMHSPRMSEPLPSPMPSTKVHHHRVGAGYSPSPSGASYQHRSDLRWFRFLNVCLLVVAALVAGMVIGWLGVCHEACGRKEMGPFQGVVLAGGSGGVGGVVGALEGGVNVNAMGRY